MTLRLSKVAKPILCAAIAMVRHEPVPTETRHEHTVNFVAVKAPDGGENLPVFTEVNAKINEVLQHRGKSGRNSFDGFWTTTVWQTGTTSFSPKDDPRTPSCRRTPRRSLRRTWSTLSSHT